MKVKTLILLLLTTISVHAEWVPFSPEGTKANCITFYVDYENHWAVGGNEILLYDLQYQSWTSYFTILPVVDISFMDGENVLLILESNPMIMEEGIHYLNPGSGTVYALEYLTSPQFVQFSSQESRYYVGHREGLKYSDNFTDWYDHPEFNDMHIVDMEIFGDHYVVSRMDNLYGIYYSDDAGDTWSFSSGSPLISDLQFDLQGKLYGVFPDQSWSSGLWSSNDYGETWDVEFWAVDINCVGTDFMGNVFVGFSDDATPPQTGIARWDSVNQQLHYLNAGLSNYSINEITYNPGMSAPALFCCTDSGAYINYTYLGLDENDQETSNIELWPNPADDILNIRHNMQGTLQFNIYSIDGKLIVSNVITNPPPELTYDCSSLESGIYLTVLNNGNASKSMKWVKR